jgi:hypothetical protein
MKFERNTKNITRNPIILTKTQSPNKMSLNLNSHIHTNQYVNYAIPTEFKLNNYQINKNKNNLSKLNFNEKPNIHYVSQFSQQPPQQSQELEEVPQPIVHIFEPIRESKPEINTNTESNVDTYYSNELIVNIHGYPSFNDSLYEFLLELSNRFKIKIYIHTWDVDRATIDYYFEGLNVVSVIIDTIPEISQNEISENETPDKPLDKIFSSDMPLPAWNIMWTSMFRAINQVYRMENDRTLILNTKFNINYDLNIDLDEIKKNKITKNIFLKDSNNLSGVDNPIIGDKITLHKLISSFYNNLDKVSMFYNSFKIPEASIYYENNRLFGVNYNVMFENIEKYSM